MTAPLPPNEESRLAALFRYEVLGTLPELAFDRIVRLVAEVLEVPVAIVNFVDRDRQWGKACFGLHASEAPRRDSLCAWTILEDDVLVLEHAHLDPLFTDNPVVTGEPHVHLYAGAPLITPEGLHVGTLCVTDHRTRPFGERERRILRECAAMVVGELEFRLSRLRLEQAVNAHQMLLERLARQEVHARAIADVWMLMEVGLDPELSAEVGSDIVARAAGLDWAGLGSLEDGVLRARTLWASGRVSAEWQAQLAEGLAVRLPRTQAAFRRESSTFIDEAEVGFLKEPLVETGRLRAFCVVPLGRPDQTPLRWLGARLEGRRSWSPQDRELVETVARHCELLLARRTGA
jgi:GAF domain-containing protein